jgi:translocation and assembly module TamA
MPAIRPACALALVLLLGLPMQSAQATRISELRIQGVEDDLLDNLRGRLSIAQHPLAEPLSDARLEYLLEQVPTEARRALEPFGYYDAEVAVDSRRRGDAVRITLRVDPGLPIMVRARQIAIEGPAGSDRPLQKLITDFQPASGQVFDHRVYEDSKRSVQRGLLQRGYFDAQLDHARVEVTRAEHAADIELAWTSGPRARFGELRVLGSQVDPALIESRAELDTGAPYDQAELLAMHQRLLELDYFAAIDLQPQLAEASGDPPVVPIELTVTPAKRSVYRAGVSYGSDNGAGIRLGFDRRYVNQRGHKIASELELGQRRSTFGAQYRVPAFERWPGWWAAGVVAKRETGGAVETDLAGFLVSRSFELFDDPWVLEGHVQRERFEDQYTTLVFPALRVERKRMDEPLYPRAGYGLSALLRAGSQAIGSDVDFVQALAQLRWVRGLGESQRLLLRGEIGRTWGNELQRLPPSLRFYAGGDRSVRGYGYQELGPRDAEDRVIGGRNLLVGSAEVEHMFNERWGAAVFVDAGNAFSGTDFDPAVGVGVGLRWRSPVGPVRLDIGHGLDGPRRSFRLHLTIGPQL